MMKESIENLYDSMQEEIQRDTSRYKKIRKLYDELGKLDKSLNNTIGKEEYKIFDKYITLDAELINEERKRAFVLGFKLANRLIIESMKYDNK